jgi:hypothetical protein
MACFIVPAAEAVVTTIVEKSVKSKEMAEKEQTSHADYTSAGKIPFSRKLKWLNQMLWGGSALLAFEHVWHGEVVPFFPFLTAAQDPVSTAEMLHEMSTVGVGMAAVVTLAWAGLAGITHIIEKRPVETVAEKTE